MQMLDKILNVKIWIRVCVVLSLLWLLFSLTDIYDLRRQGTSFYFMRAFLPIILFWGITWVVHGIKSKKKKRSRISEG